MLVADNAACPASHPYRIPQISYLFYYLNGTDGSGAGVSNWRLASDMGGPTGVPGGSLHGDWLGGWHDVAVDKWTEGCFDPRGVGAGPRNCSEGQTGTDRRFRQVSKTGGYDGPKFLKLPE